MIRVALFLYVSFPMKASQRMNLILRVVSNAYTVLLMISEWIRATPFTA